MIVRLLKVIVYGIWILPALFALVIIINIVFIPCLILYIVKENPYIDEIADFMENNILRLPDRLFP